MNRNILHALAGLLGACAPALVAATPITFNFTGTALGPTGIWANQGTSVSGSYTYDTALVDGNSTNTADFFSAGLAANHSLGWDITVSLGAVTRSSSSNSNPVGFAHHFLEVLDGSEDRFRLEAPQQANTDDFFRIILRDHSPSPPDLIATGSGNLTGTVPMTAPSIALATTNCSSPSVSVCSLTTSFNSSGTFLGRLYFRLDTITLAVSVPEPATIALLGLGLAGFGVRRRRRPYA